MFTLSVDTQRLKADATYIRELVLQSNSTQAIISIPLCVKTAALIPPRRSVPVLGLVSLLVMGIVFPITLAMAAAAMGL